MTARISRATTCSILLLGALVTLGCDDLEAEYDSEGQDSDGQDSDGQDSDFRVSNGGSVFPYGGSEAITRTIVSFNGCTGTLIDNNRWVLTAKHCPIWVGSPVTHVGTGQVRWVDQVVDHPGAGNDARLVRLDETLDVQYDGGVVVRTRATAELVGDAVTCMGYGAGDYGSTCTSDAQCQAGEYCAAGARCLTPASSLGRADFTVGWVSGDDDYFFMPRNALDQMMLPGDSGGPCWRRRDAATPADIGADGMLIELQAVNSAWYFDMSGNTQLNVGTIAEWIFWETRGSGLARFERSVNNQLHPGTFGNPYRQGRYARDFVFVAPHTGPAYVTMSSTELDSFLHVLDAGLAVVSENDDTIGRNARVMVNIVEGQTYVLRASSYASLESGTFTLMVSDEQLLPNFTASASFSNTDDLNPTHAGRFKDDYWFVAPTTGRYAFQVDASGGSAVDTYLQLTHPADQDRLIGWDDDGGPGLNSRLELDLREGEGLWIRATTYGAAVTGSYTVRASSL